MSVVVGETSVVGQLMLCTEHVVQSSENKLNLFLNILFYSVIIYFSLELN